MQSQRLQRKPDKTDIYSVSSIREHRNTCRNCFYLSVLFLSKSVVSCLDFSLCSLVPLAAIFALGIAPLFTLSSSKCKFFIYPSMKIPSGKKLKEEEEKKEDTGGRKGKRLRCLKAYTSVTQALASLLYANDIVCIS